MDPKKQKQAIGILLEPPSLPPGEDEVSLNRHIIRVLKRGRGNHQLVTSLMEKTYPLRKADALNSEKFNLNIVLVYLQCSDQVSD